MQSAPKKIALVAGANKGIGFEVAFQLAVSCCTVLLGALNQARGDEAVPSSKIEMAGIREGFLGVLGPWIG
jgi:NAD(P)-dependent dehydrogenase (short-subunit alcohol dehydrogenase family)